MTTRSAARYEDDVYTWSQQQAEALRHAARSRANLPEPVDFANVAEEIESLGASELRELYRHFQRPADAPEVAVSARDALPKLEHHDPHALEEVEHPGFWPEQPR
jgi:hypothetical protein